MKAVVFDFDGTLVDSNRLKYDAFFELFADDPVARVVLAEVLSERLEETRQVILRTVLERLSCEPAEIAAKVGLLSRAYGERVLALVKEAPEMPGAEELLRKLSRRYLLFLSSTTPQEALDEIVAHRGWTGYFKGVFGSPRRKIETLQDLMRAFWLSAGDILVVGDGASDRDSAHAVGCAFFAIMDKARLRKLEKTLC